MDLGQNHEGRKGVQKRLQGSGDGRGNGTCPVLMQSRATATSQLGMGRRKEGRERVVWGTTRCGCPAESSVGYGVGTPSRCILVVRRRWKWTWHGTRDACLLCLDGPANGTSSTAAGPCQCNVGMARRVTNRPVSKRRVCPKVTGP